MQNNILGYAVGLVILLVIVIGGLWFARQAENPNREEYTALAQCLKTNGTIFYGAFWCPACAQQKTMFGSAVKELPYIECSTPDRSGQTQICQEKGVRSYPDWEFQDGRRACGIVPLEVLAHLSGCTLPQEGTEGVSVEEMYQRLVEDVIQKRLSAQNATPEEITEGLEMMRKTINTLMEQRSGATIETATDIEPLLGIIYEVLYRCAEPAPTVEIEEGATEISEIPIESEENN